MPAPTELVRATPQSLVQLALEARGQSSAIQKTEVLLAQRKRGLACAHALADRVLAGLELEDEDIMTEVTWLQEGIEATLKSVSFRVPLDKFTLFFTILPGWDGKAMLHVRADDALMCGTTRVDTLAELGEWLEIWVLPVVAQRQEEQSR